MANTKKKTKKRKGRGARWGYNLSMLLFCLPMMLVIFVYSYLPMAGLIVAFKDYNYGLGIWDSPFIGFKNFEFFFKSPDFFRIVRNTLGYNLIFIVAGVVGGVIIALLLYEITNRPALKAYQTFMFIPYFLSWVVVSYIMYAFLNPRLGIINQLAESLGRNTVDWYNNPKPWPAIIIISYIWKNIGMHALMYYANLMSIDPEYYEAATIEGANKLQIIWHITIPFLMPLMTMLILLDVGKILYSDFGLFYQLPMNSTMLYETTDVIETYVFRALMEHGNIGMSSAVGFIQSVLGFILVSVSNFVVRKVNPDYALF